MMGNYKTVRLQPDPSGGFSGTFSYTEDEVEDYLRARLEFETGICLAVYDKNNNKYQTFIDNDGEGIGEPINVNYDRIEFRVLADYAKVESIISSIPQDLTIYTDDSVRKLNAAVEEVIAYRGSKDQKIVDGYADNIKAAIDALEPKKEDQTTISYSNTEGNGAVYEAGSGDALTFVFKRSENDDVTFAHFSGVNVDGSPLSAADFKATEGSVNVELAPEYLATLAVGEHTLTALFDDGNDVTVGFRIVEKEDAGDSETKPTEPTGQTGDTSASRNVPVFDSGSAVANAGSATDGATTIVEGAQASGGNTGAAQAASQGAVQAGSQGVQVASQGGVQAGSQGAVQTTTPETGDKNHTPAWIAAIAAAGVALTAVVARRRKKEQ